MDEKMDDDLKKRITEVFDNFEDTSANEGWLRLREKFPAEVKSRRAAWLWWCSAAAVLLLFVGILWFNYTPGNKSQLAINKKPVINTIVPKTADNKAGHDLTDNSAIQQKHEQFAQNEPSHTDGDLKQASKKSNIGQNQAYADNHKLATLAVISVVQNSKKTLEAAVNKPNNIINAQVQPLAMANPQKDDSKSANISAVKIENTAKVDTVSNAAAKSMAVVITKPGVDMQQQTAAAKKLPFSYDENIRTQKEPQKIKSTEKRVRFDVYAATYFNYSKGSNNQLNVGAGVTSDIRLSKNLKLSTGIAIGQNTLTYQGQPSAATSKISVSVPSSVAEYYSAASNAVAASGNYLQSKFITGSPTLKNYNANLVGLDIPINLKFVINPQKGDTYVSAGLSSGTFINETYTYSYNYPALFNADVAQEQNQSVRQSFNSFYFAKTLNLSFGTGYSVGKNRLVIEPFMKYPLNGVGLQQLRFGAGGVNLKFNFQGGKK